MPKVYFNDCGLRNTALNRFFNFRLREDRGALLENYVFNRLTAICDADTVRFWRTADNKEIDFVISTSYQQGLAYEVKMSCRPLKGISHRKFTGAYTNYPLKVISYDTSKECKWVMKL